MTLDATKSSAINAARTEGDASAGATPGTNLLSAAKNEQSGDPILLMGLMLIIMPFAIIFHDAKHGR